MSTASRGSALERRIADDLRAVGWIVTRTPASRQPFDLVALRWDKPPALIQIKGDKGGPFVNFKPLARAELLKAAERAGAAAWLVHRPPRGETRWYAPHEWPSRSKVPA